MTAIANTSHLGLATGPHWSSFEELRVKHAEKLGQISPGSFGTLKVKRRNFVIVDESDFERFERVMKEVEEMLDRLELLQHAAAAAEKHQDAATITMLRATTDLATKALDNFMRHSLQPFDRREEAAGA